MFKKLHHQKIVITLSEERRFVATESKSYNIRISNTESKR